MTARAYLSQLSKLEETIRNKEERAAEYYELAGSTGNTALTGMPRNPSPSHSPMEDALCKAVDLENEIRQDKVLLQRKKVFLLDIIGTLESHDEQSVLICRYFKHMSWDDISAKLIYSERWVYKLHDRGMAHLDSLLSTKNDLP